MQPISRQQNISWLTLVLLTLLTLWAAHAVVFFAHEYAHSFTAWVMGWKRNPLALNYAHPTLKVFLMQMGISQNVDELPMFASGHGAQAAIISAAGSVLGNGLISFPLSRWLYSIARKLEVPALAIFAYWCTVASIGNFIDYVPIRTFITGHDLDQDMFAVEQGLHWSPWTLLVVLGIPTAIVVGYFCVRIEPETLHWLFPRSRARRVFVAVLTAAFLFAFYGAAGWSDGGVIAHRMSVISVCVVAPVVALLTAGQAAGTYRVGRAGSL